MGKSLDDSRYGPDVEASGGPDGHASEMGSGLFAFRHNGPDQISCRKPEMDFLSGQISSRESEGIEAGPLIGTPSRSSDRQCGTGPAHDAVDLSDAGGIETMGLRDPETGPVPLGPSPGARLDRKTRPLEPLE